MKSDNANVTITLWIKTLLKPYHLFKNSFHLFSLRPCVTELGSVTDGRPGPARQKRERGWLAVTVASKAGLGTGESLQVLCVLGTGESLQVLCVLGTGEGLTGCDGGQHGRTGHGRVRAGPVRALYSKGRMKSPLKPDGQ
jgi:hypothetical protein